ncbi:tol-pal system-associated acyl-CoA thioesterase [Methylotenera versatilis]|uniref:Tol-pal system-associated acyl-CoA thioesterase n=1 Tax=Methylotenera versatilis (strain 301) TaxID=666681 RepID=D7DMU5_METV0|nr:tol-pal system-associated acyl-CoA thioesterase [Methylotenera versatilis]ADI30872.1 tol-pal system-associated acyl-CoA thioesterase [Methylotenera versatilis 301]
MSSHRFSWPVRVYYEDTDAGGVVYHSNYLNFMERARTEWLRDLGYEQTVVKDELGVIIVVHSLSINFKKPARFNDMLEVRCELANVGRGSIEMAQTIICNGVELIQAHVKAAFVEAETFRPVAIPTAMKQDMINIQAMSLNVEKL